MMLIQLQMLQRIELFQNMLLNVKYVNVRKRCEKLRDLSSGIQGRIDRWNSTDISDRHDASEKSVDSQRAT
jgi:hypothetical protein